MGELRKDHQKQKCVIKTKDKIIHTPNAMYRYKSWAVKRAAEKNKCLKYDTNGEFYKYQGPPEKQISGPGNCW